MEKINKDDSTKEILKKLEDGVKDIFTSENYINYLKTMSKFNNYSYRNSMLLLMQKPDATLVAGFTTWKKEFQRYIKKGEQGLKILAPVISKHTYEADKKDYLGRPILDEKGKPLKELKEIEEIAFKPIYVFDYSQTEGKPLPELTPELKGDLSNYKELLKAILDTSRVKIEFSNNLEGKMKGYFSDEQDKIVIRDGMSQIQTLKTAIHEIAHSYLHTKKDEKNEKKGRKTAEVEAESVAYVVLNKFKIDSSYYSFPYIANWSSDRKLSELKSSLNTIQYFSNDLIQKIKDNLKVQEISKENRIEDVKPFHLAIEKKDIKSTPLSERIKNAQNKVNERKLIEPKKESKEINERGR